MESSKASPSSHLAQLRRPRHRVPPPQTAGNSGPVDHPNRQRRPRECGRSHRIHRCKHHKPEQKYSAPRISVAVFHHVFHVFRGHPRKRETRQTPVAKQIIFTEKSHKGATVRPEVKVYPLLGPHRLGERLTVYRAFNHEPKHQPGCTFCSTTM